MIIHNPKDERFILTSEKYDIRVEGHPIENTSRMKLIYLKVIVGDLALPIETCNAFPEQAINMAQHLIKKYERFVQEATGHKE